MLLVSKLDHLKEHILHFFDTHGKITAGLGEITELYWEWSSQFTKHVLDFRYVAPFRNQSASNAKFCTFCPL